MSGSDRRAAPRASTPCGPRRLQPAPIVPATGSPTRGRETFNTLFPYHRVPWLVGIVGCGMQVSTVSQTVWPIEYLGDDWFARPDQGFSPRMEWLAKLLDFLSFIVDSYYPADCIPTLDMISRGPGDLLIAVMGVERCYIGYLRPPAGDQVAARSDHGPVHPLGPGPARRRSRRWPAGTATSTASGAPARRSGCRKTTR